MEIETDFFLHFYKKNQGSEKSKPLTEMENDWVELYKD